MHRSSSFNHHRGSGHHRPKFEGRRHSPPRRFGRDDDGHGHRRFGSFRNMSPPGGRPMNVPHRGGYRDERPAGAPFSQSRPFGTNKPMFQLRVENLCGNIHDQVLKQELLHIFRRHGNCSVYVVGLGRGMCKEAYVTFWSLEESRNARRMESERPLYHMPMFIHIQREPRVFGTSKPSGHSEFRRDSGDRNEFHDQRAGGRPRHDNFRGGDLEDTSAIPTRTLFVGNLDTSITEKTLAEIFGRYGSVEQVDIKAPRNGATGTFAFVRFEEVSSAMEAKVDLHHTMVGSSRVRLGYGRGTPSARIRVGGLGSWCTLDWLTREFDRFGIIHHIEYKNGSSTALVSFDSVDAASAAAREMNKANPKDEDHALVVSFAEGRSAHAGDQAGEWDDEPSEASPSPSPPRRGEDSERRRKHSKTSSSQVDSDGARGRSKSSHSESESVRGEGISGSPDRAASQHSGASSSSPPPSTSSSSAPQKRRRQVSTSGAPGADEGETKDEDEPEKKRADTSGKRSIVDGMTPVWSGALGLRNMSFPMLMFVVSGNGALASSYLREDVSIVTITQRLRLDMEKLDEVQRRMSSSGPDGHCVLLALAAPDSLDSDERTSDSQSEQSTELQSKPLRNLVMFLKQKQAAGVAQVSTSPSGDATAPDGKEAATAAASSGPGADSGGVLHAFPPSDFARSQLSTLAEDLSETDLDEDHLVVVIVGK